MQRGYGNTGYGPALPSLDDGFRHPCRNDGLPPLVNNGENQVRRGLQPRPSPAPAIPTMAKQPSFRPLISKILQPVPQRFCLDSLRFTGFCAPAVDGTPSPSLAETAWSQAGAWRSVIPMLANQNRRSTRAKRATSYRQGLPVSRPQGGEPSLPSVASGFRHSLPERRRFS